MIERYLYLLSIILLSSPAAAQLTLGEAVRRGLNSDEAVKEQAARAAGAEASLEQARAGRLGGFRLKAAYTDGNEPVYAFASAMKQGSFSMASMAAINDPAHIGNYMGGIEAGIPLFTANALSNGIKSGELAGAAARDAYDRARAGVSFKVTAQWLTVLLRRRLSALAGKAVSDAEAELKTAQMLKERGMVLGSDYYGAEAILSGLRGRATEWDRALELEKEKLGIAAGTEGAADAAGELAEAAYGPLPQPAPRRDVAAMQKIAGIYSAAEATQKDSLLPTVEAFGSWETNSRSLSGFSSSVLGGIRLSMPIGDPAYRARARAAGAEAEAAANRAAASARGARIELAEARAGYESALAALPVARATVDKARQSYELFRPLYRQGRQSVLEVLRARAALLEAEAGYSEQLYKLHLYRAAALLAAERLDGAAINGMASALAAR